MNFDFLKETKLNKVEDVRKGEPSKGRVVIERNPTNGASLRLFKDGSIYPSQEVVDKYYLEYGLDHLNNGFDIIDSRQWNQYPQDAQPVVFIAAVPKKSGLVDLFASAKKEDVSVMSQGSKTFGPTLIQMLEEVYGYKPAIGEEPFFNDIFNGKKYIDLLIVEDVTLPSLDGIYNVPKTVAKGEKKGQQTTKRRENIVVNPLTIFVDNAVQEIKVSILEEVEETI